MFSHDSSGADPWSWITGMLVAVGAVGDAIVQDHPWWVPIVCSLIGAAIPAMNWRAKAADRAQDDRIARLEEALKRSEARADELAKLMSNGKP